PLGVYPMSSDPKNWNTPHRVRRDHVDRPPLDAGRRQLALDGYNVAIGTAVKLMHRFPWLKRHFGDHEEVRGEAALILVEVAERPRSAGARPDAAAARPAPPRPAAPRRVVRRLRTKTRGTDAPPFRPLTPTPEKDMTKRLTEDQRATVAGNVKLAYHVANRL